MSDSAGSSGGPRNLRHELRAAESATPGVLVSPLSGRSSEGLRPTASPGPVGQSNVSAMRHPVQRN
eukprot:14453257-Alexandrium_andersonii.AAC.1